MACGMTLPGLPMPITLPAHHWAYNTYAWLSRLGLIAGDPEAVLTYDQGAALVQYAFNLLPKMC